MIILSFYAGKDDSWPWPISILIAVLIAVPAGALMAIGIRDASEEAMRPRPEHQMYRGIYRHIRHPQAAGEVWLWWGFAFLPNSPFLALFSFIYIPIFLVMCWAEEQDLLLRYGEAYAEYCTRATGRRHPHHGGVGSIDAWLPARGAGGPGGAD